MTKFHEHWDKMVKLVLMVIFGKYALFVQNNFDRFHVSKEIDDCFCTKVGDTLRYFEAGQKEAVMSRGNSRKLTRGTSSNSLLPRGPGQGLNPEALFSVAAMATAPVGTTVIEDEESESDSGKDSYGSGQD